MKGFCQKYLPENHGSYSTAPTLNPLHCSEDSFRFPSSENRMNKLISHICIERVWFVVLSKIQSRDTWHIFSFTKWLQKICIYIFISLSNSTQVIWRLSLPIKWYWSPPLHPLWILQIVRKFLLDFHQVKTDWIN